jgi:hypothetical protein
MTEVGETRPRDQADISGTNDCYIHSKLILCVGGVMVYEASDPTMTTASYPLSTDPN